MTSSRDLSHAAFRTANGLIGRTLRLGHGTWLTLELMKRWHGCGSGIRQLNDSHGTPNSAARGYHETITRAYVELLAEFLNSVPQTMPSSERVARLLATRLAAKEALLRFHSRERLMSSEARATWIEPDLLPLQLANLQCNKAK
jgi:hypothetical protein